MHVRTILSVAAFEARVFARTGGAVAVGVLWIWAAVAFAQETPGLRRSGITFAWSSMADALALALALAPLLWILQRRPAALAWQRRVAPSLRDLVLGQVGGLVLAASGAAVLASVGFITLERILVGTASPHQAVAGLARGVRILLPLAAIAPWLAGRTTGSVARVACWLVVLTLASGVVGLGVPIPLDRLLVFDVPEVGTSVELWSASMCATAAGLVLSTSFSSPRSPDSRTLPCASASSATSTATSRH